MSYRTPTFAPQAAGRGRFVQQLDPINTSQELVDTVNDPRRAVFYTNSGRRLSAQQLAAAYRRLQEGELRQESIAQVEQFEAELRSLLDSWRAVPHVPSQDEYKAALSPKPFVSTALPPAPPDYTAAEAAHREKVREVWRIERALSTTTAIVRPAMVSAAVLAISAGLGVALHIRPEGIFAICVTSGGLAGFLLWQAQRERWRKVVDGEAAERAASSWGAERDKLASAHAQNLAEFQAAESKNREAWEQQEAARTAWAARLVQGDVEAIDEGVSASLAEADFPFETHCVVGIEDAQHVRVSVSLPRIDDVIPEVRHGVLKNGSIRTLKRPVDERNLAYAHLAVGVGLTLAAHAFEAGPTLEVVGVAGFVSRPALAGIEAGSDYIYELAVARSLFSNIDLRSINPLILTDGVQIRLAWGPKGHLKPISAPPWAAGMSSQTPTE